jgi:8-oxo-dGTP pyrophosphatase MutT (NUDIX family)
MFKENRDNGLSEVVVVLPYAGDRVLMQLRDLKPDIVFPGRWGFFGGSIEDGEEPEETAKRELFEEIGYRPKILRRLAVDRIPGLANLISYSFICPLTVSAKDLVLNEGIDFGFFTLREICSKRLFSIRTNRDYPTIDNPYIEYLVRKLMQRVKAGRME